VIVGVRPEHLATSPDGTLEIEVRAVEWLGHECLVSAEVGGSPIVMREQGMSASAAGAKLNVAVAPEHVHLFDVDTTERLS
jgi:ABC-type sugar transport system ATPase subunit